MSDSIYPADRILARTAPVDTAQHDGYAVPAGNGQFVSGVRVFNKHATVAAKAVISIAPLGAVDADSHKFTGGNVVAGESVLFPIGARLSPTDVIRFTSGAATLSYQVLGS